MANQGFPIVNQPFVDLTGNITYAWRQLLVSLWNRTGGSTGSTGDLLVNPGTGDNSRTLNTALSDYANVNDYLDAADTNYDGAFARALADKNHAYVPSEPYLADPNNYYHTTSTIALQSGQSITGDTAGGSKIVCDTANVPVITLGHNIYWFALQNLTIAHLGVAVAGGDGIYQGQGLTDWVDNCLVSNVLLAGNYEGANLGKAFSGHFRDVYALGNVHKGFRFTTTGNADVFGTPTGGPLQWILTNCAAQSNGDDGYSYEVTGTAFGGAGVGSSMGTLINCVTFANGHHGVSAVGTALQPLQSVRIDGGFFGQDAGQGIYLDTYGVNHSICPQFLELSGASNIYLTTNNAQVVIRLDHCGGAWFDGITSVGAVDVLIEGGNFVNNGLAGPMGLGLTWAGVRIDGGSGQINNIRSRDSGASIQSYGISVTGDDVIINGSRLTSNAIGPVAWATGPTNSVVSACLPVTINIGRFADVITDQLHVAGAAAFTGTGTGAGITVLKGGLTMTAGVPGNGITTDNLSALVSAGVGSAATGTPGLLTTATITSSVDIIANGVFHANGAAAFTAGGVAILAGGLTMASVFGNGITADNIRANVSVGIGTGATGIAGRLDVAGPAVLSSTLQVASTATMAGASFSSGVTFNGVATFNSNVTINGTLTANTVNGTTIRSSVDLIANGAFHSNTASAFAGGVTITSGGLALSSVGGNGIVVDNIRANTSLGVGTGATGVVGRIDLTTGIYLGGVAYTNP